jgi:O-antigen/teichoic acid export membrane protein
MGLKQQAISGVKWTTLSSVINTGIQLVQLAILTRLLKATDFGLMALVMVVIGFSQMFIDMGISNAIIYKQKVTDNQLNSLYWLNIFAGIIIFVIVFFLSPFVSQFYHEPELKNLILLVGITFLIQPFGQQFMILLQKNL